MTYQPDKKILRVFPNRTPLTPDDDLVQIGWPSLSEWLPEFDEVHVSCVFTWDMDYCEALKYAWEAATDKPVKLGGPAYDCRMLEHKFIFNGHRYRLRKQYQYSGAQAHYPGLYTKLGVIFTSRGCNNNCPWCFVPKREGKLKELPILPGNLVNDNNFLQCSREHQQAVFDMLHTQRRVEFVGGLDMRLINPWFAQQLAALQAERRLKRIFLACDTAAALKPLKEALGILADGGFRVTRDNTHCYALCYAKNICEDEERLQTVYKAGAMPRCQLYRAPTQEKTKYPPEIEAWARQWQRPAATKAHMERGTSFEDYGT